MTGVVLVTGADGYLGSRIAARYLCATDAPLFLWVRAADENAFQAKRRVLEARLGHPGDRVSYAWGDLRSDDAFADVNPAGVAAIVHAAAVTRFNVDAATARRVNVEGTARLLAFAGFCPSLEAVGLLSTIYASGLRPGLVEEAPLPDDAGFANHYESSKWEAEQLLVGPFRRLPWRIFRIATVIADDDSGEVTQFNALHNTLKLWYHGLLSVLPGDQATPVYLLTGDFAAQAIVEVMANGPSQRVYHICHSRAESLALGGLIDVAFDAFSESLEFRGRRILRPLLCDADSFAAFSDGMSCLGGPVGQAVSSIAPFARQLFIAKDVCNANLVAALPAYRAPDPHRLVRETCRYLVAGRWGKEVAALAR